MKRIFLLILAIFLALSSLTYASAADFSQKTATDIDEHWAETEIGTLKALSVMNGYMGNISPDSNITRAEFTALITRMFDMKKDGSEPTFYDIGKEHIFFDAISAAVKNGIIRGFDDGTFRPDNLITREEIMLIISRLSQSPATGEASYTDIAKNYKYKKELDKVSTDGIIGGYPDGSFKPYNMTTRAEAAKMIMNAAVKYMSKDSMDYIKKLSISYIERHFTDVQGAKDLATGIALTDIYYIENTYNIAKDMGYVLKNSVTDINIIDTEQNGPFSILTLSYEVKRSIDSDVKIYKGKSKLYLITINGETKIYRHDTSIIKNNFINLTWEVFQNAPDYAPIGVNAVSPTSFRISQTKENPITSLETDTIPLYFNSNLTTDYMSYARENNYDIWVMYKTDFKEYTASAFLKSPLARYEASKILTGEILKNKLDGINFDFENMYKADKGIYTNHVKEISLMAHTLGAIVSVDITKYEPTSANWSMCYNRDELSIYADYMCLMAYDQYYAASKTPGPVAGFSWTEDCIKRSLREIPSEKLILAMPYYIRVWEHDNGKSISSKAVSMAEANRLIKEYCAEAEFDSKHGYVKYSWTTDEGKSFVLWLENAESTAKRVALAKKYNLAGVASWRRGFETPDVWEAIKIEIEK